MNEHKVVWAAGQWHWGWDSSPASTVCTAGLRRRLLMQCYRNWYRKKLRRKKNLLQILLWKQQNSWRPAGNKYAVTSSSMKHIFSILLHHSHYSLSSMLGKVQVHNQYFHHLQISKCAEFHLLHSCPCLHTCLRLFPYLWFACPLLCLALISKYFAL